MRPPRVKVLGKAARVLAALGIASIGAPIFDHTGTVNADVSVGGLRSSVLGPGGGGEQAIKLVTDGAAEISRRLGHRP